MRKKLNNLLKKASQKIKFLKLHKGEKTLFLAGLIFLIGLFMHGCGEDSPIPDPEPPTPINYAPVAKISTDNYSGESPLESNITVSGTDKNGSDDIKSYYLKIKDLGVNITESEPIDTLLTLTKSGEYEALGIVQDKSGELDTAKLTLNIIKPAEPVVSQSTQLTNEVNIKYDVNTQNLTSLELEVYKDSQKILSKTISENEHSEVFDYTTNQDITKGNYEFVAKFKTNSGKDTSVVSTVEIPNYQPQTDWSSLDVNFDEDGETSVNLPTPTDKNPEDSPVKYIPESFSSNKAELELKENNELSIKGIEDQFGAYTISAQYGSDEGGIKSISASGEIYELLRLKGRIENNETNEGMQATFIPYEVNGETKTRLISKTADEEGLNETDANGNFEIKFDKRKSDLESLVIEARKGTKANSEGWVRLQEIGKENFLNTLVRAVPYAPYADRKEDFKNFVLETSRNSSDPYIGTIFDFDGSILGGYEEKGFENYTGLKKIRILDKDPFTGTTFTKAKQEEYKQRILDKDDISSITGDYEIQPEQIVFGNDGLGEDYTLHEEFGDGVFNIQASDGVILVIPRESPDWGGFASILSRAIPINHSGAIYINPTDSNERTLTHEFGHLFLSLPHSSAIGAESIMTKYWSPGVITPGDADKKLDKIAQEETYLVNVGYPFDRGDYIRNILKDDFD
ncbi:hypothetical protein [uncultured Draconibacterium sp.]|uniref:hypothetical protein n=1 Tax=uncultured Draconibacterium sp. TaxID=1573823 RepID=UPI002AA91568|nr:hypothetical protein [uncultured Draconibacterium sp.]